MLRHLDSSGRLPVGVISMPRRKTPVPHARTGSTPGRSSDGRILMFAWTRSTASKAESDRSSLQSRSITKDEANQAPKLSRLLKRHDDPSGFINKNLKSTKNTYIPEVRGRFAGHRIGRGYQQNPDHLNRCEDARVDTKTRTDSSTKRYLHYQIGKGGITWPRLVQSNRRFGVAEDDLRCNRSTPWTRIGPWWTSPLK